MRWNVCWKRNAIIVKIRRSVITKHRNVSQKNFNVIDATPWIIFRQQVSEVGISHNSYSPTTTPIYDEPMIIKDLTDFINHDYLYSWSKDVDEFLDASDIFLRYIKLTTSNTSNNEEKTSQTPKQRRVSCVPTLSSM